MPHARDLSSNPGEGGKIITPAGDRSLTASSLVKLRYNRRVCKRKNREKFSLLAHIIF